MKKWPAFLIAMALALGAGTPALAAPKPNPVCGVTAVGAAGATIKYDPFGANGLQQVDVPLVLTRNADGGAKTQRVFFVMTMPNDAPAYEMTVFALGSNKGTSLGKVLYRESELATSARPQSDINLSDQIYYNFGGAGVTTPDTVTFDLRITVPPGADLRAGLPITFGVSYVCDGTGGMDSVGTPLHLPTAVSINVNVMSALRAFYAGTTLDFGEVGQVPNPIGTNVVTTSPLNHFGVLSSGAYSVALKSDKGFTLTNGGTGTANSIAYQLNVLGRQLTSSTPNATTQALLVNCRPSGLQTGENIYVQGKLLQGGAGKNPSPNYTDTLTVTFTPLIDANAGTTTCGGSAP